MSTYDLWQVIKALVAAWVTVEEQRECAVLENRLLIDDLHTERQRRQTEPRSLVGVR